jgi:hypothetical protein
MLDINQQMQPDVSSPGQIDNDQHGHYRNLSVLASAGLPGGQESFPDNLPSAGMVSHPCP